MAHKKLVVVPVTVATQKPNALALRCMAARKSFRATSSCVSAAPNSTLATALAW